MSKKSNIEKTPPKSDVKFNISLCDEQKEAKQQIIETPVNYLTGGAGSGKTLLAVQIALDLFFKRRVNQIIITRPTVSTESNGFLPGSEKEKMEPWLVPIKSNMKKIYDKPETIDNMFNDEEIQIISLTHFRGRTFENAVCIIDEFQNLTKEQMKMCIGRLGKGSIMIFTGDKEQIDLKERNSSAIHDMYKLVNCSFVKIFELKTNHRNEAIFEILRLLNG
jgi:phosphate starvation-inducible PhoH-like protein